MPLLPKKNLTFEALDIEKIGRSVLTRFCLENCAFLLAVNHMDNGMFCFLLSCLAIEG